MMMIALSSVFLIYGNALRLNNIPQMDLNNAVSDEALDSEAVLDAALDAQIEAELSYPMQTINFAANEKLVQRSILENKFKAISPGKKPLLFFIGDSMMRNQAGAACAVVNQSAIGEWDRKTLGQGKPFMAQYRCEGKLADVVVVWAPRFQSYAVRDLKKRFSELGEPDVIYFGANWHPAQYTNRMVTGCEQAHKGCDVIEQRALKRFREQAHKTFEAYHTEAPGAQLKLYLAHQSCEWRPGWKTKDRPTDSQIKSRNEILVSEAKTLEQNSGTSVKVVDGYAHSKRVGCDASLDGIHFDNNVMQELLMMLEA